MREKQTVSRHDLLHPSLGEKVSHLPPPPTTRHRYREEHSFQVFLKTRALQGFEILRNGDFSFQESENNRAALVRDQIDHWSISLRDHNFFARKCTVNEL